MALCIIVRTTYFYWGKVYVNTKNIVSENFVNLLLTFKAPITTAADDIHKYFFIFFFRENKT